MFILIGIIITLILLAVCLFIRDTIQDFNECDETIEDLKALDRVDKLYMEEQETFIASDAQAEPFYLEVHIKDSIDISQKELKEMFQRGMISKSAYCNLSMRLTN